MFDFDLSKYFNVLANSYGLGDKSDENVTETGRQKMKYDNGQKLNILSQACYVNWSCERQWNDAHKVTENRMTVHLYSTMSNQFTRMIRTPQAPECESH
ncbi:hypothetical protein OUZ56_000833 [Daphnia magna]|uniref:Uncharacterized protein n=1 Tax=Daphnia magna TaxID=35525 RepID=A0ABR0A109_9CRUS|nr:hypothetical protein OUZ56_000833 [Daphnia magna]